MPSPEILFGLSERDYHASTGWGPDKWVTRSMLKDYLESKRGFYLRHILNHPCCRKPQNKGMRMGSLVEAIWQNDMNGFTAWPDEYLTAKGNRSTSAAAEAWKKEQEDAGVCIYSDQEYANARLMLDEMDAFPYGHWLLNRCLHRQVTIRWEDEQTGLRRQIRLDLVGNGYLADLKTGEKHPDKFLSSCEDWGYDLQHADYSDAWVLAGGEPMPFVFPYLQNKYPFAVDVIKLPEVVVESARERVRKAMDGIAAEDWDPKADQKTPTEPEVPAWWLYKHEHEVGA